MNPEVAAACSLILDWLWANPRTNLTEVERDLVLAEIRDMNGMIARQEAACREMCKVDMKGNPLPDGA